MKTHLPRRTMLAAAFLAVAFTGTAVGPHRIPLTLSVADSILKPDQVWETDWVFPIDPDETGEPPTDIVLVEGDALPEGARHASEAEFRVFAATWASRIGDWSDRADRRFTWGILCPSARGEARGLGSLERGYSVLALACPRDPNRPGASLSPRLGYVNVVTGLTYVGAPKRAEIRAPHRWAYAVVRIPPPAVAANPER